LCSCSRDSDYADFGLGVRRHARGNRANGERRKQNQNSVSAAEKCRFTDPGRGNIYHGALDYPRTLAEFDIA